MSPLNTPLITIFNVTLNLYVFSFCSKHVEFFAQAFTIAITLRFEQANNFVLG